MSRITIVVDNQTAHGLAVEHGLALAIDSSAGRFLFDTGAGAALLPNVAALGMTTDSLRRVILSHGHYDHTGGLAALAAAAPGLEVFAAPGVTQQRYSCHPGQPARELTMPENCRQALETAAECLTEAEGQLRRRFSPILNDRAGKYFQELTAGRYKSLYVEKSFAAGATEAGGTVSRDRRSLSAGTVAQMYLAVRLAMSSILGDEKNLPPLILDDALCTFDDQRMGLALETLKKIAEERQVILFTCQSREAEYAKAYM